MVEAKQQPTLVLASNHPTPTAKDIPESQIAPKGQGKARPIPNREKDARTGIVDRARKKRSRRILLTLLLSEKDRDRLKDPPHGFASAKKRTVGGKNQIPSFPTGDAKKDSSNLANPNLTGKGPNPNPLTPTAPGGSAEAGKSTGNPKRDLRGHPPQWAKRT